VFHPRDEERRQRAVVVGEEDPDWRRLRIRLVFAAAAFCVGPHGVCPSSPVRRVRGSGGSGDVEELLLSRSNRSEIAR